MKLISTLLFFTIEASFAITPLNMKLGYWEYKTDLGSSPMIKKAMAGIAKLPKEQRDLIIKQIGGAGSIKTTHGCITSQNLMDFEDKVNGSKNSESCKMIVSKSTNTTYKASRKCKESVGNMDISVVMKNDKEGSSTVKMPSTENNLKTKMTWLSSKCPKVD